MAFWTLAYTRHWVTADQLKGAVITATNPYGQITPEEFQQITGEEYTA